MYKHKAIAEKLVLREYLKQTDTDSLVIVIAAASVIVVLAAAAAAAAVLAAAAAHPATNKQYL